MGRGALGAGAVILVLAAGCQSAPTTVVPPRTSAPGPASTATPTTSTGPPSIPTRAPTARETPLAVLPAELVGAWSSSGEDTEIAYRFLADGRFRSIEILSQPRPGGVFEFRRQQDGTASTSGDRLRLRPARSVTSRTDPDDPSGNYADRPSSTDEREYAWHIDGTTLVLTGTDGITLQLERQP
jgi:hypothetical protein